MYDILVSKDDKETRFAISVFTLDCMLFPKVDIIVDNNWHVSAPQVYLHLYDCSYVCPFAIRDVWYLYVPWLHILSREKRMRKNFTGLSCN